MQDVQVALVGLGTVGTGVARLLVKHGDRIARHAGRHVTLKQVVVKDPAKERSIDLPTGLISDDLKRITGDPEIVAVALLIGGLEPARSIMLELLESGKDVVTANKALLAEHGPELFDRARELGRSIAFEASVAGGIPIIANISQCLSANQIESLHAILNGTSNFILTQMEEQGIVVRRRRAPRPSGCGYAEADPTMDVDGTDAAQKLAILAHLAFGARVHWQRHSAARHRHARRWPTCGTPRSWAIASSCWPWPELVDGGLELHVSPTLGASCGTPLAEVRGAYNAISVVGDAVGRVFFHGLGAGQMPTASAVVADLIDTVVGRTAITFRTLGTVVATQSARVAARDYDRRAGRFYLRFNVDDRPGVLAEIAGVLGKHGYLDRLGHPARSRRGRAAAWCRW